MEIETRLSKESVQEIMCNLAHLAGNNNCEFSDNHIEEAEKFLDMWYETRLNNAIKEAYQM